MIVKAKYPVLRAVETMAVLVPLYWYFARIYLTNSLNDQSAFYQPLSAGHRPVLHGHGVRERRIRRHRPPDRQPANGGHAQMVLNLIVFGVVIRLLASAARRASPGAGHSPPSTTGRLRG